MMRILFLGPLLFGAVTAGLTLLKYEFLIGLGWHPLRAPTFDWPSGLAFGPYGFVMTATFVASGALVCLLGLHLRAGLSAGSRRLTPSAASKAGATLMACAGLALAGLAFTADPTIRTTPATWHGRLHDLSFVLLGLTLMPAMFSLGAAFRRDPNWRTFGGYTWLTASLALPAFFLKGAAFYGFLFSVLLWMELLAWRLNETAGSVPRPGIEGPRGSPPA
jgi:hypothetical protein